jgi:hypothetical protein
LLRIVAESGRFGACVDLCYMCTEERICFGVATRRAA